MPAPSSRLRSAVRDLRPRGRAWLLIAGACIAGVLMFLVLWLGNRESPADRDVADEGPIAGDTALAALPAPLPASEAGASGIEYPPPPPAPSPPPDAAVPAAQAPLDVTPAAVAMAEPDRSVPRPVSTPAPNYPRASLRRGEAGEVLLRVHVGANGRTQAIDIVRSSQHRRLDHAAVAAVRRWRFEPAMRDGQPVPGEVQVPVDFAPETR